MSRRSKEVRQVVSRLDEIIEEYKKEHPASKRDWRTYEQQFARRAKSAFHDLGPLVEESVSSIKVESGENRGNEPKLTLKQKVLVLLLKHFCGKSNRTMEWMVVLFSMLTNIDISYKTIERLYSDEAVRLAIFNLHSLLLKKKGINEANCGGDGTGHALLVSQHYATSFKSEKEAFERALAVAKEIGIKVKSLRLDKYYSGEAYVKICQEILGKVKMYILPKKNIATLGVGEWCRMIYAFTDDTKGFLSEYFQRNQSESGFSEDKKRTGWRFAQKREERIDTAYGLTTLWHNLFWVGT